jgi:hypothetical protein
MSIAMVNNSWNVALHNLCGTVQRSNLKPKLFENDFETARKQLKQYIYLISKCTLNRQMDITITFTKEEIEDIDK